MSKNKTQHSRNTSVDAISRTALAKHLGLSYNYIPKVEARFNIPKDRHGFRKVDIFRKVHGIEPLMVQATLNDLKIQHSGSYPNKVCILSEIAQIADFTETLWMQGLIHVTDLADEYGYAYDTFRKKLKNGTVDLPPVAAIKLSPNRTMYRPIEVILWRRHGITLNLPPAIIIPGENAESAPSEVDKNLCQQTQTSGLLTASVFEAAIAATDEESGLEASNTHNSDIVHKPRT